MQIVIPGKLAAVAGRNVVIEQESAGKDGKTYSDVLTFGLTEDCKVPAEAVPGRYVMLQALQGTSRKTLKPYLMVTGINVPAAKA